MVWLVNAAFAAKLRLGAQADGGTLVIVENTGLFNPLLTIQAANSAHLSAQRGGERPMSINDLPVLSALRTKMQWHQERQRVLAENVSNANTPNFRPSDLVEPKF